MNLLGNYLVAITLSFLRTMILVDLTITRKTASWWLWYSLVENLKEKHVCVDAANEHLSAVEDGDI